MTTVLLVRHGRTSANATGMLAGQSPGIDLDELGAEQAAAVGARLAAVPLAAVVASPLERCVQTAQAILAARSEPPALHQDARFIEAAYGDWTGRELKGLVKDPLWPVVQNHPSAARFPGPQGESIAEMSARAVAGVRDWNAKLGADATYAITSHGDVIKAIVADALGLHLDLFQRITVDPCSLTVIRYAPLRPFLVRLNDRGGPVDDLRPAKRRSRKPAGTASTTRRTGSESDAVVGGGPGASH